MRWLAPIATKVRCFWSGSWQYAQRCRRPSQPRLLIFLKRCCVAVAAHNLKCAKLGFNAVEPLAAQEKSGCNPPIDEAFMERGQLNFSGRKLRNARLPACNGVSPHKNERPLTLMRNSEPCLTSSPCNKLALPTNAEMNLD